jgi:hypothetical protein
MSDQEIQVLTESKRRAGVIVRGTQNPDSGWYDSPDDLESVIAEQIDGAAMCAVRIVADERDALAVWIEMQPHANQCSSRLESHPLCDCWKSKLQFAAYLAARDARVKAEGRRQGLEEGIDSAIATLRKQVGLWPYVHARRVITTAHIEELERLKAFAVDAASVPAGEVKPMHTHWTCAHCGSENPDGHCWCEGCGEQREDTPAACAPLAGDVCGGRA